MNGKLSLLCFTVYMVWLGFSIEFGTSVADIIIRELSPEWSLCLASAPRATRTCRQPKTPSIW